MTFGAAYIRVSTDHQDEYSPDAQRRCILDYAKKNGIVINKEHIFADIGISGTKADKREAFQKMIALAKSKEHPIDTILVWKFSRFARNQEESILYKSLLSRSNVSVISVSEPINEGPFGKLIERILEWMDEYYSIRLSGEVKRGMMQKALAGGYNSKIPYGYAMNENKIPTIVPEQAKVVQIIFDQYVNQHESISNIALMLNKTGYRTARGNKFERRVIHYILQNPFYIGQIRWNYAPRARGKKKDGDIIIRDGKHEPLISVEMFEKAQELIKNALILAAITLIAGLLLGAAHQVTLEPIQKQQEKEKQESCQNVFPEAASFEEVTMSDAEQAELTAALIGHGFEAQTIDELLLAKDASGATIGLVEIISTTEGYGGGMQFSMGIASDGTTKGISFLSLSETAGLGMRADTDDFKNQFKDKNVEAFSYTKSGASADDEIDALSGATLTTNAVTNGVNAGICCFNYCNESGLLSGEGGNS